MKWIDEGSIHAGLKFDGRIAEDFKLATGTFVSVGPLRAKIIAAGAPYVQDAVLTGINGHEVGALIFPTAAGSVLDIDLAAAHFQKLVNDLASTATGSATRIARLHVMREPPSLDKGEVTDKGSINQSAVLIHRRALVQALHLDQIEVIFKPCN